MATKPEVMEKLVMQPASSSYPTLGNAYKRAGHQIDYPPRLVRTGENYYDPRARIPSGQRISTAAEELAIQLGLERAGQDPIQAGVFDDLFGRNDPRWYAWQWTETGLRVPEGRKADTYETDAKGRKYWARTVLIGNNEIGEILVPEGNNRVVVEWDEVSGLPRATEDIAWPHSPYTTHFWFNQKPSKDNKSGHYDVAVGRRSGWPHDGGEGCLGVTALFARSDAYSPDGVRPVRGSAAEVKKTQIADEMEEDYGKIPLAEFREKYQL